MKIKKNKFILIIILISILIFLFLIIYQNCAPYNQIPTENSSSLENVKQNAPFAFDTTIDQITYMSCTKAANDVILPGNFFTFKVGAYSNNVGVKINKKFRNYMGEKYPNYTEEELIKILSESPQNANAGLQIAIRSLSSPHSVILENRYANIWLPYPLTSSQILTNLISISSFTRLNYLNLSNISNSKLEGSLYINEHEQIGIQLRNEMINNNFILSLTYAEGSTYYAKKNIIDNQTVFGTAFRLSFTAPPISGNGIPKRILSNIEEISFTPNYLEEIKSWSCPSNLRFKIIALENESLCPSSPNPNLSHIIYRHLANSNWRINTTEQCVIPLNENPCYKSTAITSGIKYDDSVASTCDSSTNLQYCPHYVSICVRN